MDNSAWKDFVYSGTELELFRDAVNWRAFWQSRVAEFIGEDVLEVGAGIGTVTKDLARSSRRWRALEPDPLLSGQILRELHGEPYSGLSVLTGTICDLPAGETFDTVLYVDVLEHISSHGRELDFAASKLRTGGYAIILVPAWPSLFSEFDEHVGHFRRYSRRSLLNVVPPNLDLVRLEFLDSVGLLMVIANRFLTRKPVPSANDIRRWDRFGVPLSRRLHPLLRGRIGKSLLFVGIKR